MQHPILRSARRGTPSIVAAIVVLTAAALSDVSARAAIQSSDAFNYSPVGSDLLGKSGGAGWAAAWAAGGFNASFSNNFDISSGTLTYPGLESSGERVSSGPQNAISGISRPLAIPIPAAVNQTTTRYLSVLLRLDSSLNVGAFNGFFGVYLDGGGINDDDLYIGKPGGGALAQWVVETRGGAGQVSTGKAVVSGQTTLLVLKADLRTGADTFSLVANPTLPGAEPAVYDAVKSGFDLGQLNGITIYSAGHFSVDEIRWGETYADVTPIPEPATILPVALGVLLAAGVKLLIARNKECRAM
jgi:hypothetical protein